MEIERKFLIKELPDDLESYRHEVLIQGYLSVNPVVRVRREGERYVLTYKGSGLMAREEANLPLTDESFYHLIKKADGIVIKKTRYYLPILDDGTVSPDLSLSLEDYHSKGRLVELDIFEEELDGLMVAEVEFPSIEEANSFTPLIWFGDDVTNDPSYHNSYLSRHGLDGQKL
ncbi:MAG: CYTH domain-containing protein [Lachnospiraceae bacterium]|nr:CYTH domain-containing protein [Lachnospiraceae bacterium]